MTAGRAAVLGAVVVLLAACQSETVTTTTVLVASSSTTTSVATTTTTTARSTTVDVCSRGVVWEAGTTYVADCFARPLTFQPTEAGWVSAGASGGHLLVRWADPDDRDLEARIALIMYAANQPAVDVFDRIAAVDEVEMTSDPEPVEVVGWPGLAAEFEGRPEQNVRDGLPPCTIGDAVWFPPGKFGHAFFDVGMTRVVGIGACQVVQAWAIDADGLTVTILAGTEDPEKHEIAVDAAERLFASMTFGPPP